MSKILKKSLAAFLALLMFMTGMVPSYAAMDAVDDNLAFYDMSYGIPADQRDYTIENPYKDIDWEKWGEYKTQLHCHTTASDGFLTIHEFVHSCAESSRIRQGLLFACGIHAGTDQGVGICY